MARKGDTFKRDILLSALVHGGLIVATVISAPLSSRVDLDYDEIIRVSIKSMPEIRPAQNEPAPLQPLTVPDVVTEAEPEIPLSDPSTADEVPVPDQPKPKPKPKPPKSKLPRPKSATKEQVSGSEQSGADTHVDAPASAGSSFSGATVDNASFQYPYWFTQTFNKIASNFRNPVAVDGRLICTIYFQVIKSGRVAELRVEQSSGISEFDQACLAAVERAAPFPPLPRQFADEILGITLPIANR